MTITKQSHPGIFGALLGIDYDNGAVNCFEPEATEYAIPEYATVHLPDIEAFLAGLSEHDLGIVCGGEESEALAILNSPIGRIVHQFLNDYFNGWVVEA